MNFALESSVEILQRTPDVLRAMLSGLSEPWARGTEGPDTFSPFDVVGHLIDGEETDWMVRAKIILEHGESRPFDRYDRFRHWKRNKDRSLESLLDEFGRLRAENLTRLAALKLSPRQLDITGTHPVLGVVTLRGSAHGVHEQDLRLQIAGLACLVRSTPCRRLEHRRQGSVCLGFRPLESIVPARRGTAACL